eukprot:257091-Pleurochrysis_carterae.AAC.3
MQPVAQCLNTHYTTIVNANAIVLLLPHLNLFRMLPATNAQNAFGNTKHDLAKIVVVQNPKSSSTGCSQIRTSTNRLALVFSFVWLKVFLRIWDHSKELQMRNGTWSIKWSFRTIVLTSTVLKKPAKQLEGATSYNLATRYIRKCPLSLVKILTELKKACRSTIKTALQYKRQEAGSALWFPYFAARRVQSMHRCSLR